MFSVVVGIAIILLVFAIVQLIYVVGFDRALKQKHWEPLSDAECPQVAVMLPLRGTDPFLKDCVHGLLNQDYPKMQLHVIVDSLSDPAWKVIHEIVGANSRASLVKIEALKNRLDTCGLKNSSLLQFEASLDDSVEVIAIIDADVVAHPTWLRELVAPLAHERYGAASGNRWYMPEVATWGSLVRYIWNAGAVVQMFWNNYAWGGSVAARRSSITDVEKNEGWRRAIASLDTSIHKEMQRQGKIAAFVPTLLMTNREACDLAKFFPWVQRQLLLSRLYSPKWLIVIGHGLLTSFLLGVSLTTLMVAAYKGDALSVIVIVATLILFLILMVLCIAVLENAVRRVVAARGEKVHWLTPSTALRLVVAMPLTQVVYTVALLGAATMRRVSWRGINYQVKGPYEVTMEEYRPYTEGCSVMGADTLSSL